MKRFLPILLFAAMIVALQWPQIKNMIWPETFPPSAFTWLHSFEEAQQTAVKEQKQMLVVFSASWCPPCKRMKQEVWPDPEVGRTVQARYVPVYIDVDEDQHRQLQARYQVEAIPAVFVLDTEGKVLRQSHYLQSKEMLSFLESN